MVGQPTSVSWSAAAAATAAFVICLVIASDRMVCIVLCEQQFLGAILMAINFRSNYSNQIQFDRQSTIQTQMYLD